LITTQGHVVEGFLTPGNVSDITVAPKLTEDIVGCYVALDMGYDSDEYRERLRGNGNIPVIPGRSNRNKPIEYDKRMYKQRGRIERLFGMIKENRRLTVRYEKSDCAFLAFIAVAIIKINL
jgi:transposase